jgi:hypothetical protein
MNYRNLTTDEINQLERQGCEAADWTTVTVSDGFSADNLRNVRLSGSVQLGAFSKVFTLEGGVLRHSGLRNVALHNVTIGDDCLVEDVHEYIANYNISNGCRISNVDIIVAPCDRPNDVCGDVKPRFGNGIEVTAVNEAGGREVTIHNRLSAQQAYIQAMYRYRPKTVENLKQIIRKYVATIDPNRGEIGECATITDCGTIREVNIGSHATLRGAKRLTCGSINSNAKAPVTVGDGVIADEFIISSGSHVDEGALLTRCFVGQACHIGRGFSAIDSLFFSNCHMENGEACSLFAGPYTVSHHKSTLLIAGLFSFMNAGSGTNQSNHGYRIGPMYQGVMDRGCKTASDSYVLWPAHIGAFTLVKGRHTSNPDIYNLPFSYLLENEGKSYLVPGVNLARIGTLRDALKWPERDGRTDDDLLDTLNFDLLNPYTISAVLRGSTVILNLGKSDEDGENGDNEPDDDKVYDYKGVLIKRSALEKGSKYYLSAMTRYAGSTFYKRLKDDGFTNERELRNRLKSKLINMISAQWLDMAGMLAPADVIVSLMNDIDEDRIDSLQALEKRFADISSSYDEYEWLYVLYLIEFLYEKPVEDFEYRDFSKLVYDFVMDTTMTSKEALSKAEEQEFVDEDADEFDVPPSYGIDWTDEQDMKNDFINVHGRSKTNPTMQKLAGEALDETNGIIELMKRIEKVMK